MQSVEAASGSLRQGARRPVRWDGAVYGYPLGGDDRVRNDADSAPFVPRSVVTNPWFEWGDDHLLRIPWHDTVLYECHVTGFTKRHPGIPPGLRGTYAGLAHPAAIDHLRRLGVTTRVTAGPITGFR